MTTQQLVHDLWSAIEAQQFDRAFGYLSDDFVFDGPMPERLNRTQWIDLHRDLAAAMPDITINYVPNMPNGESYGVVSGSVQLAGTHTGAFDVLIPGAPRMPATGKRILLPREKVDVAVDGGKVQAIKVEALPEGGLNGILNQMGVLLPEANPEVKQ